MTRRLVAILAAAALLGGAAAAGLLIGRGHGSAHRVTTTAPRPAGGKGVIHPGFMNPPPCSGTAPSFLAAFDAKTGKTLWSFRAGVVETPPLLSGGRVYFGSWDSRIYAVDARTGRLEWRFAT